MSTTSQPMVIAIDPHKASWTAAVVDASLQPVATIRVPVSHDGYLPAPPTRRAAHCAASPIDGPIRPGPSKAHPVWVHR